MVNSASHASLTIVANLSEECTFTGSLTGNGISGTIAVVGEPTSPGKFVGTRPTGGGRGGRPRPPASRPMNAILISIEETMKRISMLAAALAVTASAAVAHAQQATTASKTAPPTLIKNATVMTVTKGTMENTDILIQNGKIAQIGKNLTAPAGATVIDGTGKFVMPGIIDPHSHTMTDAINEGSLSVTSMVRIKDVLNPTAVNIYRELAGGVTTINVLHGSANTIGGQNAVVKLKYGRDASRCCSPARCRASSSRSART